MAISLLDAYQPDQAYATWLNARRLELADAYNLLGYNRNAQDVAVENAGADGMLQRVREDYDVNRRRLSQRHGQEERQQRFDFAGRGGLANPFSGKLGGGYGRSSKYLNTVQQAEAEDLATQKRRQERDSQTRAIHTGNQFSRENQLKIYDRDRMRNFLVSQGL
jgi:hypothetical protein